MRKIFQGSGIVVLWLSIVGAFSLSAVGSELAGPARTLITQRIDSSKRVELPGNVRPEIGTAFDLGEVADSFALSHMTLVLRRPAERQAELDQFITALHDPHSPNYHHWLTPTEFGARYGLAQEDLKTISSWLRSSGFAVHTIQPSGVMIEFSGSAGQLRKHFGVEIHRLNVQGVEHFANVNTPQIPVSLSEAIIGITNLHDFLPRPGRSSPAYNFQNSSIHAVSPSDLATIYKLTPLFGMGITGQGVTIATINANNPKNTGDWNTFRSTFGLSGYSSGSISLVHPGPGCPDPGAAADRSPIELESVMDPEMVTAAAPGATILAAVCSDLTVALQNLINQTPPPNIISLSYETPEIGAASFTAQISNLYQQAISEGVSIFVSAGDWGGSAGGGTHDTSGDHATQLGLGVNGLASTPYDIAVGGTQFYGQTSWDPTSSAWGGTNSSTYGSALSYVPELPWNSSCANGNLASYNHLTTYGSGGTCSQYFYASWTGNLTGGGGPSNCATGAPTTWGVAGGTCAGWPKPSWQVGAFGNPMDGVRDLPDVSLIAKSVLICDSGNLSSDPCGLGSSSQPDAFGGGTSGSAPLMAGIQALINQKTGSKWGNPASIYYQLAATEYGSSGNATCNSNSTSGIASTCIFNDITQGDNDYPCATGSPNCYSGSPASGTIGVLSLSTTSYQPAYPATSGWDFATGLGSVNAYNLASAWPKPSEPDQSGIASVLANPQSFNGTWPGFSFGLPGDIPFVMKVNGGELPKPIVYRPASGNWFINLAGFQNYQASQTLVVQFGGFAGDVPQIVNYNGFDHLAVYRSGQLVMDTDNKTFSGSNVQILPGYSPLIPATVSQTVSNGAYFSGSWNGFSFGVPGDTPLLIQLTSGGPKLPVVFRPSNTTWYIDLNGYSDYTAAGTQTVSFGGAGDIPEIVYWNGADHLAVFRPSTGQTIVDTDNQSYHGTNALVIP
jgi:hypothetical protein